MIYWKKFCIDYKALKGEIRSSGKLAVTQQTIEELLKATNFASIKYGRLRSMAESFASSAVNNTESDVQQAYELLELLQAFDSFIEYNICVLEKLRSKLQIEEVGIVIVEDSIKILEQLRLDFEMGNRLQSVLPGLSQELLYILMHDNDIEFSKSDYYVQLLDHSTHEFNDALLQVVILFGASKILGVVEKAGARFERSKICITRIINQLVNDVADGKLDKLAEMLPMLEKIGISLQKELDSGLIHAASKGTSVSLAKYLLEKYGFQPWITIDHYERTPLHYIVSNDALDLLSAIWKKEFSDDSMISSLIEECCINGSDRCLGFLLQKSQHQLCNAPCLFDCIEHNSIDCLRNLVGVEADVNEKCTKSGRTPLIEAVRKRRFEVAEFLLLHGADVNVSDSDGWRAIDHAYYRGEFEFAELLKKFPLSKVSIPDKHPSRMPLLDRDIVENQDILLITINLLQVQSAVSETRFKFDLVVSTKGINSYLAVADAEIGQETDALKIPITVSGNTILKEDSFLLLILRQKTKSKKIGVAALKIADLWNAKLPLISSLYLVDSERSISVAHAIVRSVPVKSLNWSKFNKSWRSSSIPARSLENTIASFMAASSAGAEFIEFGTASLCLPLDVQVTRDNVPVLYHDFWVQEDPSKPFIGTLPLSQFKSLCRIPRSKIQRRHSASGDSISNFSQFIACEFPTLEEALESIPDHIGFNVEVKYPSMDDLHSFGVPRPDINVYCDAILSELLASITNSSKRFIFLSSFDPDVCVLLAQKQNLFPVLFITEAGLVKNNFDDRRNSLRNAFKFSKSAKLDGIVCDSTVLAETPKLIEFIRSEELLLFSYGERNNDIDVVREQVNWGINGVIVDHIGVISKGLKLSTPHA